MNFGEKKFSIWIKRNFFTNFYKFQNSIFLRSTPAVDHKNNVLKITTNHTQMNRLQTKNGLHVTETNKKKIKSWRELKKRLENRVVVEEW